MNSEVRSNMTDKSADVVWMFLLKLHVGLIDLGTWHLAYAHSVCTPQGMLSPRGWAANVDRLNINRKPGRMCFCCPIQLVLTTAKILLHCQLHSIHSEETLVVRRTDDVQANNIFWAQRSVKFNCMETTLLKHFGSCAKSRQTCIYTLQYHLLVDPQ